MGLGILIRRQSSSRKQANKQIKRDEKFSLERQIHAANMQRNRTICTILEIKENHLYLGDLVDAPEETIGWAEGGAGVMLLWSGDNLRGYLSTSLDITSNNLRWIYLSSNSDM